MGRPPGYQWQPLGVDADPVPGDPQAISAEAAHLASVATTITGQIAALRKIASDNAEVGQHAEKIRSSATSLAGSLQVVEARYRNVSSALNGWVPELEQAQSLSIRALNEAEAPYATVSRAVTLPSGPDLTAAQKQEIASYHTSMQRAQDQLDTAKALLTRATTLRDTQAAYYAAKINQASNDSLTDHQSFWGGIENLADGLWDGATRWVAANAGLVKDICQILEIAATVLAVAAIFLSGGTLLLVIGAVLAGMALVGRSLLVASGKGSWLDVIMDVIALASFGGGELLGRSLQALVDSAKSTAATEFVTSTLGRLAGRINSAFETLGSEGGTRVAAKFIEHLVEEAPHTLPEVSVNVTRMERLETTGDIENVVRIRTLRALAGHLPDNEAIADALEGGTKVANMLKWNFRLASGAGIVSLLGSGLDLETAAGRPIVQLQVPLVSTVWSKFDSLLSPSAAG